MVIPNIPVFVGWGLLTALFIPAGWRLYRLYKRLYFGFGQPAAASVAVGDILPALRRMAADSVNREA